MEKGEKWHILDAVASKENTVLWAVVKHDRFGVCMGVFIVEEDENGNELNSVEMPCECTAVDLIRLRMRDDDSI